MLHTTSPAYDGSCMGGSGLLLPLLPRIFKRTLVSKGGVEIFGLDHGVGHPLGLCALHKRLRTGGRGLGPTQSSLLACALPCGQTLHHDPHAVCAKRATFVEISRQICKEGKKKGEKVPPSWGVA